MATRNAEHYIHEAQMYFDSIDDLIDEFFREEDKDYISLDGEKILKNIQTCAYDGKSQLGEVTDYVEILNGDLSQADNKLEDAAVEIEDLIDKVYELEDKIKEYEKILKAY